MVRANPMCKIKKIVEIDEATPINTKAKYIKAKTTAEKDCIAEGKIMREAKFLTRYRELKGKFE